MTTVTCDGKVVASDTGITHSGTLLQWPTQKIIKRHIPTSWWEGSKFYVESKECVFAFCGQTAFFQPWIDWYAAGAKPEKMPRAKDSGCDYLWVFDEGKLLEYNTDAPYGLQISVPSAMGSGDKYAYGAFALGHSAEEALEAAMICDGYTFGEKQVMVLPEHLQIKQSSGFPSRAKILA